MKLIAAYLLLQQGGNASPSAADIKALLETVGVEAEEDRLSKLISELEGKDINEVCVITSPQKVDWDVKFVFVLPLLQWPYHVCFRPPPSLLCWRLPKIEMNADFICSSSLRVLPSSLPSPPVVPLPPLLLVAPLPVAPLRLPLLRRRRRRPRRSLTTTWYVAFRAETCL